MELNRLSKGKGIANDGASSGGATGGALEDEEIYVELGAGNILKVPSQRRQRREENVVEFCYLAKFLRRQSSLNSMVRRRLGKIWKHGSKNLKISLPYESLMKWERQDRGTTVTWSCKTMVEVACANPTTSRSTHHMH